MELPFTELGRTGGGLCWGVKLEFWPDRHSKEGVKKTSGYEPRMGRSPGWGYKFGSHETG